MNEDKINFIFECIKKIYLFFLYKYNNNELVSWQTLKGRIESLLSEYDKDNTESPSVYQCFLPLFYLGLIDIQYYRNNTFYFSATNPHYIYNSKDKDGIRIFPNLILDNFKNNYPAKKYNITTILKSFSPVYKIAEKYKENLANERCPYNLTEKWTGLKWKTDTSDPKTGFFRNKENSGYILHNNRYISIGNDDFLMNNAKTVSYFIPAPDTDLLEIKNNCITIKKHIYLLVMRVLWGETLINGKDNPKETIKKLIGNHFTFDNISNEVIKEIERIFKKGFKEQL